MWKAEVRKAVELCGGQTALAEKLSEVMPDRIDQGHVSNWLHRDKSFREKYCLPIQYVTGGKVKASALCPDTFPAAIFDDMPLDKLIEKVESIESPARLTG